MSESITAPSVGTSAKANEPPGNPVTVAVAPSQVAVNSKEESFGSPKLILMSSVTKQSSSNTSTVYIPVSAVETVINELFSPSIWPSRYHSYVAVSDWYKLFTIIGKTSLQSSILSPSIVTTVSFSSISTTDSTSKGGSSTVIIISSSTTIGFPVQVVYVTFAV